MSRPAPLVVVGIAVLAAACSGTDGANVDGSGGGANGNGNGNASANVDAGASGSGNGNGNGSGGGSGSGSSSGSSSGSGGGSGSSSGSGGGSGSSSGSGGGSGSSSGGDAAAPPPSGAPTIPSPTGTCPTIANGEVTFAPAGIPPRKVTLTMTSAAATMHGPLIFYWHATGSQPAEAVYSLGSTMSAITAAGGIVAAPSPDPNAGQFEWYLVSGTKTDDLLVADEVVACIAQSKDVAIDTTHIHSMGMSAGALQTTAMSYLRSSYLASVTTYSGGLAPGVTWPSQDPSNKFAALLFYGGANDNAFGFDFQAATKLYQSTLKGDGHFAPICNHNKGHSIPLDAAPAVWEFFQANGFGVSPSPYAGGLPSDFPTYCTL